MTFFRLLTKDSFSRPLNVRAVNKRLYHNVQLCSTREQILFRCQLRRFWILLQTCTTVRTHKQRIILYFINLIYHLIIIWGNVILQETATTFFMVSTIDSLLFKYVHNCDMAYDYNHTYHTLAICISMLS